MKKQIFLGICLIIVFSSMLSVASASELVGNSTISAANDDLNTISVTNDQEDILGDPSGTFKDLDKSINDTPNEGTLPLGRNYSFSVGDDAFTQGIFIAKNITIDGKGFTIDASNKASIFEVGPASKVILKNIRFINANGTNGAAIKLDSTSTLEIENCHFINNSASKSGAAIYLSDSSSSASYLKITGSTFINNTANYGGAIYLNESSSHSSQIEYSSFINCSCIGDGGAAYINASNVVVRNVIFENNVAGDDGGALYWEGSHGIIYNITCTNNRGVSVTKKDGVNTSSTRGGTVSIIGSNVTLSDSSFKLSSAWMDESKNPSKVDGGAIFITGNNVTIDNVDFEDCNASCDGGAIYIIGNFTQILNCRFDNCSADEGGVIYVEGHDAFIDYNVMTNNNCTGDGGALYVNGTNVKLYNTKFINNTAGDDGGAINWMGSNGTIYNITCINNKGISMDKPDGDTSSSRGGTICLTGSNVTISQSSFTLGSVWMADGKDTSKVDGGALFITGNNVNITDTTFDECSATHDGGAIYIIGNNTSVVKCSFNDGDASEGGAIYINGNTATIRDSDFTTGRAVEYGGAIAVWGANANITNSTFENCFADEYHGGAIFVAGDDASISLSNFTHNKVNKANYGHGGAIDIRGNSAKVLDCYFDDSEAYDGGVIYVSGHNSIIDNSTFKNSNAIDGGAIFVAGTNASISKSNFSQVTADLYGGAIYVEGNNAKIDESNFTVCTSKYFDGGAIYISGTTTVINNSDFTLCNALGQESRGGAIDVDGDDASIYNSNFDNNNAATGGAIYVFGHNAAIDNSTFEKDTANTGGAVYVLGDDTSITSSEILDCNSTTSGGAIYIEGENALINGTSFEKCNALKGAGGSIYIAGSHTTVDDSNFTSSIASTDGGAILVAGDDANINSSNFKNCIAQGISTTNGGGAIYITGSQSHISDSNFTGNHVTSNDACGGTIYIEGYKATIDNSYFNNSEAKSKGGIIFLKGENATINSSTLANSSSIYSSGGAIYVDGNNTTIVGSEFENIWANSNGGAIYISGAYTDIDYSTFFNCTVAKNAAGGAIFINDVGTTVSYSNFTKSFAGTAGAISINGENTTIDYCNLDENIASGAAGAIHVLGDNTRLLYNNFTDNIARGGSGGALDIGGANASVYYSCFDNNGARLDGGAINWIGGHGQDSIIGCNFTNNYCNDTEKGGGAIYWTAGDGVITAGGLIKDSLFENNTARGRHGGAINWFHALDSMFDNCTFINNHAKSDGGAIYSGHQTGGGYNLTICNSRFYNNTAGSHGGAIANQMSKSLIYNTTFDGNAANRSGGSILMKEGPADNSVIDNCRIYNSRVYLAADRWGEGGGAISIGSGDENITISNCIIINSTSDVRYGGSVAVRSPNCIITNVTIINSTALSDVAGALYWSGINGTLNNVSIINSSTHCMDNARDAHGGAIYWIGANSRLNGLEIINSSADTAPAGQKTVNGGAVYLGNTNINLTNAKIINSSAYSLNGNANGGAIYCPTANVRFENISITNSSVFGSVGGAIFMSGAGGYANNITIVNSTLTGSVSNKDVLAGAIYWSSPYSTLNDISINNSSLNYNFASGRNNAYGGAIYIGNQAHVNITNVDIDNSSIVADNFKAHGGSIYRVSVSNGGYDNLVNVSISNSHVLGSSAGALAWHATYANAENITIVNSSVMANADIAVYGGAVYWTGGYSNLINFTIINSSANLNYSSGNNGAYGGAMNIGATTITMTDVDIANSSTRADNGNAYSGAIHWSGNYGKLYNASINNTSVFGYVAGAIDWTGSNGYANNLTIINSSVVSPKNKDSLGGAIYWASGTSILSDVYITNSSVNYNHDDDKVARGGAIYVSGGTSTLDNINILNSSAIADNENAQGGSIYWNGGSGKLTNSSISNTLANGRGGAIYDNGGSLTVTNIDIDKSSAITNNSCAYGGSIYWAGSSGKLQNASINNTHATGMGGAIYWTGGNSPVVNNITIINSSTVASNRSYNAHGGAIYATGGLVNLNKVLIINSSATDDKTVSGGAIYWVGNIMRNVTVINSSAVSEDENSYGGAVFWTVQQVKYIYDSLFVNATADYGGAVYRERGGLTVFNTRFINNTANVNGGALYAKGGTETFNNVSFINNTAKSSGGAVYAESIYCHFYDSKLKNNTADYGGAIFYYNPPTSGVSTIKNTDIINNTAFQGSGIYATALRCNLENVVLLDNQAHSNKFIDKTIGVDETGTKYVSAVFVGYDNLLNGIWDNAASNFYKFTNVTYWGVNGRTVTGKSAIPKKNDNETWINITVEMYDRDGNLLKNQTVVTDANGRFKVTFDADYEANNSFKIYHMEDRYYTGLMDTISSTTIVKIDIDDFYVDENITIKLNLTNGAWVKFSGNVTVTFNDTHKTKIVIEVINGTAYYNNISGLDAGTYNATANFTGDLNHLADIDWCTFTVFPIVDLDIKKAVNVTGKANVTDIIRYTITVKNKGPSNATGVNVTEKLHEYLSLSKATPSRGSYNEREGYWYIGDLNKGETVTLTIEAKIVHVGNISNFVSVLGNEKERIYSNNNASTDNITALPIVDVKVTKSVNVTLPSVVNVTDKVKFTITVTNAGPCNATDVYVNEVLSSHLKLISADPNVGDYNGVRWTIGNLSTTFTATLTIIAEVISNGTIPNVVTVTSYENDTNKSNNKASINDITALNIVDLTINKKVNTSSKVNVADYIKYTITVKNNGPCNATNVKVKEELSRHLKLISADGNYANGIWNIGNLNVGATATLTIVAQVTSNGTIENVVSVNSTEKDTNPDDNRANVTLTAFPIVDLSINKTVNTTGPVNVSDKIQFTITVHNNGPSNATNVMVNEVLSPHLTLESAVATPNHGYYNKTEGIWHIGTLTNQSTAVLTIVAKVTSNGTIANAVNVTSYENDTDNTNNNDTIKNITALPIVDVSILKTVNVTAKKLNFTDKIEFTVTIHNAGPCNATGVYVSEILDSSLTLISYDATRGTYDGKVWKGIDTLNVGASETLTIVAQVTYSGEIENEVIVYSYENDTNYTNNKANISKMEVSTDVDLEITKSSSTSGPVNVSDRITFTIVVYNKSPANASGIVVSEVLDPHLRLISNSTTKGSYDGNIWTIGNLRGHDHANLTIVAEVISAGIISNAVNVSGYDNDTNLSNNNASIPDITAYDIVDLRITKVVNVTANVNVTDFIKFTITVHNNGPSNATDVNVSEVLSGHLRMISNETDVGYYDKTTGIWHIGTLLNQSTAELVIKAQVISAGVISNRVVVNSTETNTNKSNNNASIANITAHDIVDLAITKVVNVTGNVNVTDVIKYTITVRNNGPSNATYVNVSEILGNHFELIGNETTLGYYNKTTRIWYIGTLYNQSSAVLNITAKVISAGTIDNVVNVTSVENDTNMSNNRAEVIFKAFNIVDVNITKTVNVSSTNVNVTDIIKFTITVHNNGPCTATGVNVSEILDSSLKLLNYTATEGIYDRNTWSGLELGVGENQTLTIVARVDYSGIIKNEVTVTSIENDTNLSNNRAEIQQLNATAYVDLEIIKDVNVTGYANVTDYVRFNITVINNGPCNASGVYVIETLDSHLKMISYDASNGTYDGFRWDIGYLNNGENVTLTIIAQIISKGTISNVAVVNSSDKDSNKSNNRNSSDNFTAYDIVDLRVTKVVNVTANVNVTDYIKFTITVHNNGPCNATNVNVSEVLSGHLRMISNETDTGYYNKTTGIWHIGTLLNQSTAELIIKAQVISAGVISNVVVVNSTETDTNKSNNRNSSDNFTAYDIVDLAITKVVNVTGNVNVTDVIKYTITVRNNGPSNATNVNVSEILGNHLELIGNETTLGYYNKTTRIWYIGTLYNQSSAVLNITAKVISAGTIDNVVNVTSAENDTNMSNNRAEVIFKAFNIVDVNITKTVNVTVRDIGVTDVIKFTITVHNNGPCRATGVYVNETLDSSLKLLNYTVTEGSYDGSIWEGLELDVGENQTLTIVARVDYSGIIRNEVTVSSIENDTNISNNKAEIKELNATAHVDLEIIKDVNVTGYVNVTDYVKFNITVINHGPCNATGVYVDEALSSHLKMKSYNATHGTYKGFRWDIGYLNNGENATLTIIAEVISKGTISNVVVVKGADDDTNKSNNNDSIDDITALPIVDLEITKTVNTADKVNVTDMVQYRITVTNNGPCEATNVVVSEPLSPHLNMTRYDTPFGTYDVGSGIWKIGRIASGRSVFLIIEAKVISNGTIENIVKVNSTENDTNMSNNEANVTIEAFTIVDLSITKQVNVSGDVEVTDLIKFTLTVHNAGPCNATNVYIKESLVDALKLVSWNATKYTRDYDGYTWVIGNMSVGDTETFELIAQVVYSGIIENDVFVKCNDMDIDLSNNVANIDAIVSSAHVDLQVNKTVNVTGKVNVSDLIEFTVQVHNAGPCNASGVYVQEILDPNLERVSYDVTHGTYDGFTWLIGYLNDGETANLTIVARVISDGIISNVAIVDGFDNDTNESNNNASIDEIEALPIVDLEITKRIDSQETIVRINDIVQFTITVKNNGPSYATDVKVSEVLSPHLELMTYLTWLGSYDVDSGVWDIGNLANQEYVDLIIQAKVISNGTIENVVIASSHENDTNKSNNRYAIENITAIPIVDLEIIKEVNVSDYIEIGDLVEFTVTVQNYGPSIATKVNVTEVLDSGFKITANETDTGYYNTTENVWYIGDLAVDKEVTLKLTAQVIGDGLITNRVIANSYENDTNPYNNWDEVYVGVLPLVDVIITKEANVTDAINVTDYIEFTITVHNNGPSNATGVYVDETLSPYLRLVSYNVTAGSYNGFVWVIGNLNNGTTENLTIIAEVISEGLIENEVTVSSFETDVNETNNHDNITGINATAFVDLTVYKEANVTNAINVSDLIRFTISVGNNGPCNATGVYIDETLSPHLKLVSYNVTAGSYNGFVWVIGDLNSGETENLTIIAEVISDGIIENTVIATSIERDSNQSNNNASIDNITALPVVDLQITKVVDVKNSVVNVSDIIQFTIDVFNNGPCDAANVTVTEVLSPHLEMITCLNSTGYYNVTEGVWFIPALANQSGAELIIQARVVSAGDISNVVFISSNETDRNNSNNNASIGNITALAIVDLDVRKTSNVTSSTVIYVGDKVEYTITVTNNGPCDATDVNVTEILSSTLEIISNTTDCGKYADGIWHIGNLANQSTAALTIVARVVGNGTLYNRVDATSNENDTNLYNNHAEVYINALPVVDLSIKKEVNVTGSVVVSDLIKFTVTVHNNGPSNATGVLVGEGLNPRLELVYANASKGSYDGVYTWNVGKLNSGETETLIIVARVISAGEISNAVVIAGNEKDSNDTNNNAEIENITSLQIIDLSITKTSNATNGLVNFTDLIEFTITVKNNGPCAATGVYVGEILNPNLKMISNSTTHGSYDGSTWNIGTLLNQSSATMTIVAKVISMGNITNSVFVKAIENDTNNSNDEDSIDNITVLPIVDLAVNKLVNVTSSIVNVSDKIKFTITVKNNGPSDATGVNITEALNSNLKLISFDASIGRWDGKVWTIGNLANQSEATLIIVAQVVLPGNITNVVSAESRENDTNMSNNHASIDNITTISIADLEITKKANVTGYVNVTDYIEFIITVHNNGPSQATGVNVSEILNSNLELVRYHATAGRWDGLVWNVGSLNDGDYAYLTIVARVISEGNISNAVAVTANEIDTDKSSNKASIDNITALPIVDLEITKNANVTGYVNVTDCIEFVITVHNNGPCTATGVNVSETLNSNLELISYDASLGSWNGSVWNIGKLDNDSHAYLTIVARVISTGVISNAVSITGNENDTDKSSNNASIDNITVLPIVDVFVSKSVNATLINVGDCVTYTIIVRNNGPCDASEVNVTENLSEYAHLIGYAATQGSYDAIKNIWYVGKLTNASTQTLTLTVQIMTRAIVENSVSIITKENDTNLTNNNFTSDDVIAGEQDTPIDLATYDITYGEDEVLRVTLPVKATGYVNITVANRTYIDVPINKGLVELPVSDLAAGDYDVNVTYGGDGIFLANETSGTFKVAKAVPIITIEVEDIWVWEIEVINVTVNAPGSVFVTVYGITVEISLENGVVTTDVLAEEAKSIYKGNATWNIIGLPVGTYPAFALYPGNENYTSVNTSDVFHVRDLPTTVIVTAKDIHVGDDAVINIIITPKGAAGNVTVNVNGTNYTLPLKDGKSRLTVPGLAAGVQNVTVWYGGYRHYLPSENATTFNVLKINPPIDVETFDVKVGKDGVITVTVPKDATGFITINVEGKRYTSQIKDGKAEFVVPGLKEGEHDIDVYYSGDDKYLPKNTTGEINVIPDEKPPVPENKTSKHHAVGGICLKEYPTGNPMFAILVMILAIGSLGLRRIRK